MEVMILKNTRMKLARVERDYSQEKLAEAVGATRQTIGMIEAGNYNPSLNLCVAICKALNKTLNDLFWEED
jgi:putative transcriptional regulator